MKKLISETSVNSLLLPSHMRQLPSNKSRHTETYTLITFLLAAYSATPYATTIATPPY